MNTKLETPNSLRGLGLAVALLAVVGCGGPSGDRLSGVGGPCARYYNCDQTPGQELECIQSLNGGYCTRDCSTSACPSGSVCVAGDTGIDPRRLVGSCTTATATTRYPDLSDPCQIFSDRALDACTGGTCEHVVLSSTECMTDAECPSGATCVQHDDDPATSDRCETRTSTGRACTTFVDCRVDTTRSDLTCDGGVCSLVLPQTCRQSCTQDSDCRTELCYLCVPSDPMDPASPRICDQRAGACPAQCQTPADCGPTTFCSPTAWDCIDFECLPTPERDCSDGVDCTADVCNDVAGACFNTPSNDNCEPGLICDATRGCICTEHAQCPDDFVCTVDYCDASGQCQHVASDDFCNDANACTTDACDPMAGAADSNGCVSTAVAAGQACDDGLYCTTGERCDAAGMCGGSSPTCNDGQTCTIDTCDEPANACYYSETCAILSEVSVTNDTAGTEEAVIEIDNTSATARDLRGYTLSAAGLEWVIAGAVANLPAGARLTIGWNAPTAACAWDLCTGPLSVITRADGDVALFGPGGLTTAEDIRDYVQWGTPAHANEAAAVTAGIWTAAAMVNATAWTTLVRSAAWTGGSNDDVANWCIQNETLGLANGSAAMCL